jgi:hypothetical protein
MDIGLIKKLFGTEQHWTGACTVILDAEATVQAVGGDAMGSGGMKNWAPRTISGRINAEAVCLLRDQSAIVLLQQLRTKTATGEEVVKHTLTLADPAHVVAIEYTEGVPHALQLMGLAMPVAKASGSHSGVMSKPRAAVSQPPT